MNFCGDANVGEKHEFLHEGVGFHQLLLFDVNRIGRFGTLHMDLHFRRCEVERPSFHPFRLELSGQRVKETNGFSQVIALRAAS